MAEGAQKAALETRHRNMVTACLILASIIYAIDWTIAVVALPHMQGTFSATQDQISWVLTSYIATGAITLPATGWLSAKIGRKRLFLLSIGGFTVFSFFCGAASSLEAEVIARIGQGAFGAFLIPLSQAIMLDVYPPSQHNKAMALWSLGVILGPIIGPTLGGYLTELYTWRWVFYLSLPIGVVAFVGAFIFLPPMPRSAKSRRFDWFGFIAIACAVGGLQMMLDRGERLDWFASREIIIEAAISALGMYIFIVHSLMSRYPLVNLRLLRDRNYALGLAFIFLYGALTLAPMVLMPPFLKDIKDYPIIAIGVLMTPRGAGMMVVMLMLGRIGHKFDQRLLLVVGFLLLAVSSWAMSGWSVDVGINQIIWTGLLQGLGAGAIVVPLSVLTFATLDPAFRTEAAAMWNLTRSAGSSIGIAVALAILTRMATINRSTLTEHISPFNERLRFPSIAGEWGIVNLSDLATIEEEVMRQATMIGYIDVFYLFAFGALIALPGILFMGKPRSAM